MLSTIILVLVCLASDSASIGLKKALEGYDKRVRPRADGKLGHIHKKVPFKNEIPYRNYTQDCTKNLNIFCIEIMCELLLVS